MIKVAIIGPIGSGKSEVLRICSDMELPTISSDHIAKLLMELPGAAHDSILQEFGSKFAMESNPTRIDRHKLGEYVFTNPDRLKVLEDIIHPHVWQLATAFFMECETKGEKICFVEVTAPSESISHFFDEMLFVDTPFEIRKQRCLDRGMSEEDFKMRDAYQAQHFNYQIVTTKTVKNDSSVEDLEEKLKFVVGNISERDINSV